MRKSFLPLIVLLCSTTPASAGVSYTYDDLGRLTKAAYDNGKEIDYKYDPAGNRSSVVTQDTTPHAPALAPVKKKTRAKTHRGVRH